MKLEVNGIFDLVLVKCGHFLVKCGFLLEKSGTDISSYGPFLSLVDAF
jgi:hypothetical protein